MKFLPCIRVRIISLFVFISAFVQGQVLTDSLTKSFERYRTGEAEEKIYVHMDRSFYLTGETLWFKIYLVDASLHKPMDLSKVVYLEVVNASQQAVLQTKVEMTNGSGNGSLFLPATLNSANYSLRAYTRLMKNHSPDFYFQKVFTLVNPFVRPPTPETTGLSQSLDVQFFPEGGHLVAGLTSEVAFQATDEWGKGAECTGVILNKMNDTLVTFKPLKFGLGHFSFTPKAREEYIAIIRNKHGIKSKFSLPSIQTKGFVMHLEDKGDFLEVAVMRRADSLYRSPVYLFAHTRNVIGKAEVKYVLDQGVVFKIEKNKLQDGVSHITLFDENLRAVCERLYFKRPASPLAVNLQTDAEEYETRMKVKLNLTVNQPQANLSVSVFKTDSLSLPYKNGIAEYLWLSSDLKGSVESPEYYFGNDPMAQDATDNLMLTHGWRRFTWDEVRKPQPHAYLAEYRSHVIQGIVKDPRGTPTAGIVTYLSAPSKAIQLYVSRSNGKGEVFYETKNFYDLNRIIIQTNRKVDSVYTVEIEDPFSKQFSQAKLPGLQLPVNFKRPLTNRSIDMQVMSIYQDKKKGSYSPLKDSLTYYGKANWTYYLDDYTRFPVLEEVFREYVQRVMVRKTKDQFHLYVIDMVNKSVFENDPLLLLDGVPLFNMDQFMAFSPLKIRKIEVFDRKYFLGSLAFPGVVSCTTYQGDLGGYELDPKGLTLDYEGLQRQSEFYAPLFPDPQQQASRVPDNRSLLYWNPFLVATPEKQQFEFFTSDLDGKYQVVVEGITKDGVTGSSVYEFEVKKKSNK